MVNSKRKMLAAREDLVNKISEVANNKGFTLFGTINDVLELAIRAENIGVSLNEAVAESELIKAAKDASFTLVLENLWYEIVELAYEKAKKKAFKIWFEAGVWMAKRYGTRGIKDTFAALERDLKAFTWNASEFNIEKMRNTVSIRVLSPRFSESYTVLFNRFLEGILETYGYTTTYKAIGRGNIRLEAAKRGVDAKG